MAGPYYYATIVCVTTKDSPYASAASIADLAGGKCTAQSGTIWYDSCLPQIENAELLAPAETAPAMIMQLQTGAVDFICTDMPTAMGAAAQDDNLVILNFSGTPGDFQFASEAERAENVNIGISVRKGNTVLKDAFDSVLSTMTEEGRFSSARAEALLGSAPRQETLLGQIKEILKEKGYGGLDVDFEYIRPELGAAYAVFVDRLRRELNPLGCSVLVALAPKTFAGQRGLLYEAHDYAALGRAANGVLLMTYEWGYTAGPPMAVAPLDKVRQVVDYALTEIPAEKLFLGVPVYGYDWPLPFREGVTRGESVSPQEALALARRHGAEIRYDETAQAPWFRYTAAAGREHEVWFEDARSSYAKFRLAAEKGLQGVGLWNLMRPAPQTYLALHGGFEIEVMR